MKISALVFLFALHMVIVSVVCCPNDIQEPFHLPRSHVHGETAVDSKDDEFVPPVEDKVQQISCKPMVEQEDLYPHTHYEYHMRRREPEQHTHVKVE